MKIKRTKYTQIKEHLEKPQITMIIGPRQAGKTTIAKQLQSELIGKGEKTLFFNLDIESDYQLFETQEKLLFAIENQIGKRKAYIFIDEFQRKKNAGKFIKGIYDMDLEYKFIITGSGSIELKEEIHESLAGRKRTFELPTLSFEEYINFESEYKFENKLSEFNKIYPERVALYLQNYLTFGGYPRVITARTNIEKRTEIREIYSSYIIKDITALLNVEKTAKFQKLVENLSILDGKLLNISQLASNVGLSTPTIEKYLYYLEKTYIISPVRPFSRNPLKEINKSYTYYFNDIGLKNLISNDLDDPMSRIDLGFDFQTFVFGELSKKLEPLAPPTLNFWRSKDGGEVDFVSKKGDKLIGIEVKFSEYKEQKYTKSMHSFIKKYQPSKFFVINRNHRSTEVLHNTSIEFITFGDLNKIVQVLNSTTTN